jgi:transcriptional regulator with XRE-family HTH domain
VKFLRDLGFTIRQHREKLNVSQEKLAELADLHRNYVGLLERGEVNVSILNLRKLAKALKVNLRTIIPEE